jgi:hypothetical protein
MKNSYVQQVHGMCLILGIQYIYFAILRVMAESLFWITLLICRRHINTHVGVSIGRETLASATLTTSGHQLARRAWPQAIIIIIITCGYRALLVPRLELYSGLTPLLHPQKFCWRTRKAEYGMLIACHWQMRSWQWAYRTRLQTKDSAFVTIKGSRTQCGSDANPDIFFGRGGGGLTLKLYISLVWF